MDEARSELFETLGELLLDWVERTVEATEELPAGPQRTAEIDWALRASGEAEWAFAMLHETLGTPELQSALRVVLFWGMSGLLYSSLGALDTSGRLPAEFTASLFGTARAPFVRTIPDDAGQDASAS